jgi:5-methyltetrahydrofolate--homocysteine methyltransferase
MAMTDLGGGLDILASFVGTQNLLMECIEHPEEVSRLAREITGFWLQFYRELTEITEGQQCFSDWSSIFSEKPSYILQSDFSFMIGPDMFQEFVYDELVRAAAVMDRPFFHMDGIGELKHLDSLLSISEFSGIQWIPGAGEPETRDWSELFGKISRAGKKIMVGYDLDSYLDEIVRVIPQPDGLIKMQMTYQSAQKEAALKKLARYCEIN